MPSVLSWDGGDSLIEWKSWLGTVSLSIVLPLPSFYNKSWISSHWGLFSISANLSEKKMRTRGEDKNQNTFSSLLLTCVCIPVLLFCNLPFNIIKNKTRWRRSCSLFILSNIGCFSVWERKEKAEVAPRKMPYFKTREHRQSGTAHSRNDPEASAGPTAVVTCCLFLQFYCSKRMVGNTLTSIKLQYTYIIRGGCERLEFTAPSQGLPIR